MENRLTEQNQGKWTLSIIDQPYETGQYDEYGGQILRWEYGIQASSEYGRVYVHQKVWKTYSQRKPKAVDRALEKMKERFDNRPNWTPINRYWHFFRNTYGSEAHSEFQEY